MNWLEKGDSIEENVVQESLNTDVSAPNFRYFHYKLHYNSPEIKSSTRLKASVFIT